MRRRVLELTLLLAAVAGLGHWLAPGPRPPLLSIAGVSLGMTRHEIERRLGPPAQGFDGGSRYLGAGLPVWLRIEYSPSSKVSRLLIADGHQEARNGSYEALPAGLFLWPTTEEVRDVEIHPGMDRPQVETVMPGHAEESDEFSTTSLVRRPARVDVSFKNGVAVMLEGTQVEVDGQVVAFQGDSLRKLAALLGTPQERIETLRHTANKADAAPEDSLFCHLGDQNLCAIVDADSTRVTQLTLTPVDRLGQHIR